MSILTRLTGQHLDDAAFAEIWTNATAEGARASHPHLEACAECRVRFASFMAWMEDVRLDGVAEADAAFPGDRLAAQQAQILRRLEVLDQPTRVIAFPKAPVTQARPTPMRRWIAGAAAAGLVAGIGLGQLMDLRRLSSGPSTFPADRVADVRPAPNSGATIVPAAAVSNYEESLEDFEYAATPQYETLRAFDTMTPRAADFVISSR